VHSALLNRDHHQRDMEQGLPHRPQTADRLTVHPLLGTKVDGVKADNGLSPSGEMDLLLQVGKVVALPYTSHQATEARLLLAYMEARRLDQCRDRHEGHPKC
jgi:hypothetical protein